MHTRVHVRVCAIAELFIPWWRACAHAYVHACVALFPDCVIVHMRACVHAC